MAAKYNKKTGIYSSAVVPAVIPEQLSIYDLMFNYDPPAQESKYDNPAQVQRSPRENAVWLIDSLTGRTLSYKQTHARTLDVARALHTTYGLGEDDTLGIFSGNEVDYPTSMWGAFRLGAVVSCANPSYGPSELAFQLKLVNEHHPLKVLIVHPDSLPTAIEAVEKNGIPTSRIVLICALDDNASPELKSLAAGYKTLDDLIAVAGPDLPAQVKLTPENSRTKLAFLSFSSGTTGLPKAVKIPHYSVVANVLQTSQHWASTSPFKVYDPVKKTGDIVMGCLPFFHIFGLVVVLHCSTFLNNPVVTLNKFTFASFLETIQRWKVTTLYVVPPIVVQMVKNALTSQYDLSSIRIGLAGAAPLTEETSTALRKKFPKVVFGQGYGMTETCTIVSIFDATDPNSIDGSSAGVLAPNIEAKIVNPEGKLMPPGEIGELLSRSPSNALGYLANEKATKETFDDEGFVHTGDECYISKAGWLFVVDRIKELIKVKGNQVAPAELEGHILEHPAVQDCCVIGIPDERAGERPKAYVALTAEAREQIAKNPSAADEIIASIKHHVAKDKISYKHLSVVEFIDAVPKTASGKLLRKDLRVLHAASVKGKGKL